MSIKIHHGPPGSYKTSGAVQDDLARWAKEGRTIVTNVRGVTQDHIENVRPEWGTEVIFVDTDTVEGRDRLSRWYQWAPLGAFLLVDEAQRVFPKRWREKDLARLDDGYSGSESQTDRPYDWLDAWTRHRHFNWDLVLTTPHMGLMRPDIVECSEMCYAHKNLAVLGNIPGFKGAYMEAQHAPGLTPRQAITLRRRTIKPSTWELYESTATGTVTDTAAGQSIFANGRLAVGALVLVVAVVFSWRGIASGEGALFGRPDPAPEPVKVAQTPSAGSAASSSTARPVSVADVGHIAPPAVGADVEPLRGTQLSILGSIRAEKTGAWLYMFQAERDGSLYSISGGELESMQYRLEPIGICAVKVRWGNSLRMVSCAGTRSESRSALGF